MSKVPAYIFAILVVLMLVSGGCLWLAASPSQPSVSGVIVAKRAAAFIGPIQRDEYYVIVKDSDGARHTVAVPWSIYKEVAEGWSLQARVGKISATSPDRNRF